MNIENRGNIVKGILVPATLAAGVILSACGDGDPQIDTTPVEIVVGETPTTPSTAEVVAGETPSLTETDLELEELRELLSVGDESSFDCETDGLATATMEVKTLSNGKELVVPKVNSTLGVDSTIRTQDNRLFSDSMANSMTSAEFTDDNKESLEAEFGATMCEDPIIASMVANQFANMEVNGIKVIDLNPWLEGYQGDASTINDNAAKLMPAFGSDPSVMSEDEVLAAVKAREQHTALAEQLATLINRFENSGIEDDLTTTLNYRLVAGGLTVGQMPEVALNDVQYAGNFLVFRLTLKDGRCLEAFVINPNDQRTGEVDVCYVEIPPEDTVPGSTVPGSTVPAKNDDGKLPNTGIPADQDPGTPDVPGQGPAGQPPNDEGYIPSETRPPSQPTDTTILPPPATAPNTVPASTGAAPVSTNPPVVAPGNPTPSTPENGPLPAQP